MMYPKMRDIIPEQTIGDYTIEHFSITEKEAEHHSIMATLNRDYLGRCLRSGDFCRLMYNKTFQDVLMSDTHAERNTNSKVVKVVHDNVLIAGLGLGMIVIPICQNPKVKKVTVVEISEEVISLVEPHIRKYLGPDSDKLEIVCEDIHKFTPGHKYEIIYFDIWPAISGDEYEETKILHRRFRKYLNKENEPFMDSWLRWLMKEKHFGRW